MCELRVKFYLGQNEEYSLEDSISANSEELFQSGSGQGFSVTCDFPGGGRAIHQLAL